MPGFDSIIGQEKPIRLLQTFLHDGTLPHALLFTGMAGVGKRTVARTVAMALNCRHAETVDRERSAATQPCHQCQPCRQILSGSHPDVQLIEPQGALLRIDQMRNMTAMLAMKPFSARYRAVIIADAEAMNPEAANALLKVLEEPPSNTFLILTARQRAALLPTVVSRCRNIRFNPLLPGKIAKLLADTQGLELKQAQTIAAQAGGSMTKARLLAQTQWQRRLAWLIRASGLDQPGRSSKRPVASALAFAAQLARHKDQIQELLDVLKIWVRDICILSHNPDKVINQHQQALLTRARSEIDEHRLLAIWEAIEKAQKDIAAKANLRLTLDIMALRMAGHGASQGAHNSGRSIWEK